MVFFHRLSDYSEQELLEIKISDLKLSLKDSFVFPLIKIVKKELKQKKININPTFWFSDEWFCPDGTIGIAIPFFLAHPKLTKLERKHTLEAEGETKTWCLKLLRHEFGHVIDNAYGLRRYRERSKIFGKVSVKYPIRYDYLPYSKRYVRNLGWGYAQSHPAEDFAETFATWLDPDSNWKERYGDWPCIQKIEFVDKAMKRIQNSAPTITTCLEKIDPIEKMDITLKDYYKRKCRRIGHESSNNFWRNLLKREKIDIPSPINKEKLVEELSLEKKYPKYVIERIVDSIISYLKQNSIKSTPGINEENPLATRDRIGYHLKKNINEYINKGHHLIYL